MTYRLPPAARWPLLLLPLLLAACAGSSSEFPPPSTAAAPASSASAADTGEPKKPKTQAQASAECWMQYEKGHASLDVRMKLVDKCIDEKMKAAKQ
ncbi:MAG TPA: hypothetical protein VFB45_21535 [Pseudolabrys sp.]|nr:hypothetical protein [Pseudolabrys sp.]